LQIADLVRGGQSPPYLGVAAASRTYGGNKRGSMQFVVFAAFAIVLSLPPEGPAQAWVRVSQPFWIWLAVAGYVLAAATAGGITTRRVKNKLDQDPAWLPGAQRRLGRGNTLVRVVLLVGFGVLVYLTGWTKLVRGWDGIDRVWGLDELVVLLPFFLAVLVSWTALHPADCAVRWVALEARLWASVPARPPWSLRAFLRFRFRQDVLIIAVPMLPILAANDFVTLHAVRIRQALWGIGWADQAVLVAIAGAIFTVAPVMLRYIWHTRVLPKGELRDRLEGLCRRVGLKYQQILVWESDGMMINAAVMGLFRPVRYVLLSDGLLEMMDDAKIEAVFGHEAGHVKCRHIEYYLLFAVVSMLIVGGIMELVGRAAREWPGTFDRIPDFESYVWVLATVLILLIWSLGFGAVSRKFELQADLFGTRSVTPKPEGCDRPCFVHGTAQAFEEESLSRDEAVCASAAELFAGALERIARLNGIPIDANSWRHSSISDRMTRLREYAIDPDAAAGLDWTVMLIKGLLTAGTVVGLAIAVYLYWPQAR
jgi:STE24 endopeptidase